MHGITWEFNKQQIKNSANSLPPGFEIFSLRFFRIRGKSHKSNFHYVWGFNIRSPDSHLASPSNLHRFMITPFIRIRGIPTIIVWLKQFSFIFSCVPRMLPNAIIFLLLHVKSEVLRDGKICRLRRDKCKFQKYLIVEM